jgi:PAS domain S-box-containing protein
VKTGKVDIYTILSVVMLGLIVMAIVIYEINQSRDDLLKAHTSEAENLIDAIGNSFENNGKASQLIDEFLIEKLNVFSAFIGNLENGERGISEKISKMMNEFNIDHVSIIDKSGKILFSSVDSAKGKSIEQQEIFSEIGQMFADNYLWYELGNIYNPIEGRGMYMFARDLGRQDLIVLTGINNDRLLEFRKQAGVGKLIKDFTRNKDIIYLVMQDSAGIYAASPGMNEISSITLDTMLLDSWKNLHFRSRLTDYSDRKVLEGVKTFENKDDGSRYIIRLALSVEKIRAIQQSSMIRAIIMGGAIFLTGGFIIALLNIRTRLGKLKLEHQRMQQYTSHILGNINNAVVAVDRNMKIIAFNKFSEKIFAIKTSSVLGNDYNSVFPNDEIGLANSLTGGAPFVTYGLKYRNPKGEERILETFVSFLPDEKKETDFVISIIIDMTEKIRADEALRHKDKMTAMGELAGGVAHEIRNPLNSISVISQRFELEFEPKTDSEEFYKLTGIIKSETKRMNNIIKQFLEFARPPKLNTEKGDIVKTIADSINLIEGAALSKGIQIIQTGSGSVEMLYDKEKIKQALLNLLKNAAEAMPNGGKLLIDVQKDSSRVKISISDTGCGIPDDIRNKIFNLYFTTKDSGSGIGLSIVNQVISEHSGNITVESKVNEGTRFLIELPVNTLEI